MPSANAFTVDVEPRAPRAIRRALFVLVVAFASVAPIAAVGLAGRVETPSQTVHIAN